MLNSQPLRDIPLLLNLFLVDLDDEMVALARTRKVRTLHCKHTYVEYVVLSHLCVASYRTKKHI